MTDPKPLNWTPKPGVGFTVLRREDGGMTLTFTDLSDATLKEWHDFALEHLRAVKDIPEKAVRTAVEVNSDPSARNIRLAVVVADEKVASAMQTVAALALPEMAAAMKIFTDMGAAEDWLARPLDQIA